MSLINDALKKAQRERSGEPASENPPGDLVSPPPSQPAPPAPASSGFKGWPVVAIAALVVVGFLGWRLLAPNEAPGPVVSAPAQPVAATSAPEAQSPTETAATTVPVPTPSPSESEAARAPAEQPAAVASTASAEQPSSTRTPEPGSAPVEQPAVAVKAEPPREEHTQPAITVNIPSSTSQAPSSPPELPATVITIPQGPAAATTGAPLISLRQQDPRILAYLDTLVVNGIRPSPDDPKVLMNNRVFRVRDIVERELNLRLTEIAPAKLTFEDERGMVYIKNF